MRHCYWIRLIRELYGRFREINYNHAHTVSIFSERNIGLTSKSLNNLIQESPLMEEAGIGILMPGVQLGLTF